MIEEELKDYPLVSILISAYKAEEFLASACENALSQSWPNKEIVIIDNESEDSTYEIALSFKQRNVKIVRQKHTPLGGSRNKGIEASTGDYIQFMDVDDYMLPNKIEVQMERLLDNNLGFLATCCWGIFHNDISDVTFRPDQLWHNLTPENHLFNLYRYGLMTPVNSYLIPRHLIEKVAPWNSTLLIGEDSEYFSRLIQVAQGVLFCDETNVYYQKGDPNSLSQINAEKISSMYCSLQMIESNILRYKNNGKMRSAVSANYQNFVHQVYPFFPEYTLKAEKDAKRLSRVKLQRSGSKLYIFLSKLIGWKLARRIELYTLKHGLNRSMLKKRFSRNIRIAGNPTN